MKYLNLLIILLGCWRFSFSQELKPFTIEGKLFDSVTSLPLTKASLLLIHTKSREKKTTISDDYGLFKIKGLAKTGDYILIISFVGYDPQALNFHLDHDTILPSLYLAPTKQQLDSVVVTQMLPQISMKIDRMVVTLGNSSLAAIGNSIDLLQKMPGVILQQDGIILLNGKLVEVWVDGRPTNLFGNDLKSFLSSLPSSSINRVELISNPSALFDAQASAIINIITNKIKKLGWNANLNLVMGYGNFARYYPGMDFNYRKNKLNIYGSYNFQYSREKTMNFSERPANASNNLNSFNTEEDLVLPLRSHNVKLGMDYDINSKNFIGFTTYFNNTLQKPQSSSVTNIGKTLGIIDSLIRLQTENKIRLSNPSLNVYYRITLDTTGKQLQFNLDYWNYQSEQQKQFINSYYDNTSNPYRHPELFRNSLNTANNIYSIKLDYTYPLNKSKIITGLKAFQTKRNNKLLWENLENDLWINNTANSNKFLYDENTNAVYFGWESNIKKIKYQLSGRMEETTIKGNSIALSQKFNRTYWYFFPGLNIQYELSLKHQIKLSYRRSINRPQYYYLDPFVQFENQYSYFQGNLNLRPELSGSLDFTYSYNNSLFATFSYGHVSDALSKIYSKNSTQDFLISTYDNLATTHRYEMDVSYNVSIAKKWSISLSSSAFYNYVNTFFQNIPVLNKGFGINAFIYNNISLPKNYSIDVFFAYSSPYHGTIFKYVGSGFINLGLHKPVFKGKATFNISLSDPFRTSRVGYQTNFNNVGFNYKSILDSRFVTASLFLKLGNRAIKNKINRTSGIETEKARMK